MVLLISYFVLIHAHSMFLNVEYQGRQRTAEPWSILSHTFACSPWMIQPPASIWHRISNSVDTFVTKPWYAVCFAPRCWEQVLVSDLYNGKPGVWYQHFYQYHHVQPHAECATHYTLTVTDTEVGDASASGQKVKEDWNRCIYSWTHAGHIKCNCQTDYGS